MRMAVIAAVVGVCLAVPGVSYGKDKPQKKPASQKMPKSEPELAGHHFFEFNVPGAGVVLEQCGKTMTAALDASGQRERFKALFHVKQRCTAAWLFQACAGLLVDEELKRNRNGELKNMEAFTLALSVKDAVCTSPSGITIPMDGDIYETVKAEWLKRRGA